MADKPKNPTNWLVTATYMPVAILMGVVCQIASGLAKNKSPSAIQVTNSASNPFLNVSM
jgi:hypothetical protein